MLKLQKVLRRGVLIPLVTFLFGCVLGLLYAWYVSPIEWANVSPSQLQEKWREDYLRAAINSYFVDKDPYLAIQHFVALGSFADDTLQEVIANPSFVNPEALNAFKEIVEVYQSLPSGEKEEPEAFSIAVCLIPIAVIALLAGVAAFLVHRRRRKVPRQTTPLPAGQTQVPPPLEVVVEKPAEEVIHKLTPKLITTFKAIYKLGDDSFAPTFGIEAPDGTWLGECGIGIVDVSGETRPSLVTAFEVWLYDQNDERSLTSILMSRHSYNDQSIRSRLENKGEPVLAIKGGEFALETVSLKIVVREIDVVFGVIKLHPEAYFERLTLEVDVYRRKLPNS